jgi:hypothetical protein
VRVLFSHCHLRFMPSSPPKIKEKTLDICVSAYAYSNTTCVSANA